VDEEDKGQLMLSGLIVGTLLWVALFLIIIVAGSDLFANRFLRYDEVGGSWIPMHIASEQILPDGKYLCAEHPITGVEYNMPDLMQRGES